MLGSLSFGFDMSERAFRLDPRVWKTVMTCALSRAQEGLVVCDEDLGVLFATSRALHLLGRLGMSPGDVILPLAVKTLVSEQLEKGDATRVDRLLATRGAAILVCTDAVRGVAPAHAAIWVREELLRDDALFAALQERFPISLRSFQLAQLVRKGLSNRDIATQLHLTESTVKVYLHKLYRDCGVSSRTGLVALLERLVR